MVDIDRRWCERMLTLCTQVIEGHASADLAWLISDEVERAMDAADCAAAMQAEKGATDG